MVLFEQKKGLSIDKPFFLWLQFHVAKLYLQSFALTGIRFNWGSKTIKA